MRWREFGPIEDSSGFGSVQPGPTAPAAEPPTPTGAGNVVEGEGVFGSLIGTTLDIPGKGVKGFHVTQDGAWDVGGTDVASGVPRIDAVINLWTQPQLQLWHSAAQTLGGLLYISHTDATSSLLYLEAGAEAGLTGNLAQLVVERQVSQTVVDINASHLYLGTDGTARAYIIFGERTAPSAPAANEISLYACDVGGVTHLYAIDSASTVSQLTGLGNPIVSITYAGNVV